MLKPVILDGPTRDVCGLELLQPVTAVARRGDALDDVLQELFIGDTAGIGFEPRIVQKRLQPHDPAETLPKMRTISGDGDIAVLHTKGAMWRIAAMRRPERRGELATGEEGG
jgi:hypothetical protein